MRLFLVLFLILGSQVFAEPDEVFVAGYNSQKLRDAGMTLSDEQSLWMMYYVGDISGALDVFIDSKTLPPLGVLTRQQSSEIVTKYINAHPDSLSKDADLIIYAAFYEWAKDKRD